MTAMNSDMRILIAGGGTGGHVYPALAIVEALRELRSCRLLYVGGRGGVETRIVPHHGLAMETIWIAGFARRLALKNLLFPLKLAASLVQSWRIVRRFRPHAAVGTGGYVTGPILWMAARLGVPVLIQEQDIHPGVTTRLLAGVARRICLAFEEARTHFPGREAKLVTTGNPVRTRLLDADPGAARAAFGLDPQRRTLLIFGGSQGARAINSAMTALLPVLLADPDLQVIWQSGPGEFDAVRAAVNLPADRVALLPYVEDMAAAYTASDLIVCRAGASSLAELAIVARPTVLVPYPHAAGNHQERNARAMVEGGAALMVTEHPGWEAELDAALRRLLGDRDLCERQSAAWRERARPDAARRIAGEIITLAESGGRP